MVADYAYGSILLFFYLIYPRAFSLSVDKEFAFFKQLPIVFHSRDVPSFI